MSEAQQGIFRASMWPEWRGKGGGIRNVSTPYGEFELLGLFVCWMVCRSVISS